MYVCVYIFVTINKCCSNKNCTKTIKLLAVELTVEQQLYVHIYSLYIYDIYVCIWEKIMLVNENKILIRSLYNSSGGKNPTAAKRGKELAAQIFSPLPWLHSHLS